MRVNRNESDCSKTTYTTEKEAKGMLIAFLETKFDGLERHERRLEEIEKLEANN